MSSRSAVAWRLGRLLAYRGGLSVASPTISRTALLCSSASPDDTEQQTASGSDANQATGSSEPGDECPAILQASLQFVPEFGWTPVALREGARSLGLPPSSSSLAAFPQGGGELIDHFERECNSELIEFMEQLGKEEKLTGHKLIRSATEHRLRMLVPYMDKWPQAMALKAFPSNAPSALESLAVMVDDIWYCAGDRSTDFNWYTKRALLAAVYSSTEMYMVQDGSVDYQDTWDFLDRRLQDTTNFSKARKTLEDSLYSATDLLSAGATTARNMLGLNSHYRS